MLLEYTEIADNNPVVVGNCYCGLDDTGFVTKSSKEVSVDPGMATKSSLGFEDIVKSLDPETKVN